MKSFSVLQCVRIDELNGCIEIMELLLNQLLEMPNCVKERVEMRDVLAFVGELRGLINCEDRSKRIGLIELVQAHTPSISNDKPHTLGGLLCKIIMVSIVYLSESLVIVNPMLDRFIDSTRQHRQSNT